MANIEEKKSQHKDYTNYDAFNEGTPIPNLPTKSHNIGIKRELIIKNEYTPPTKKIKKEHSNDINNGPIKLKWKHDRYCGSNEYKLVFSTEVSADIDYCNNCCSIIRDLQVYFCEDCDVILCISCVNNELDGFKQNIMPGLERVITVKQEYMDNNNNNMDGDHDGCVVKKMVSVVDFIDLVSDDDEDNNEIFDNIEAKMERTDIVESRIQIDRLMRGQDYERERGIMGCILDLVFKINKPDWMGSKKTVDYVIFLLGSIFKQERNDETNELLCKYHDILMEQLLRMNVDRIVDKKLYINELSRAYISIFNKFSKALDSVNIPVIIKYWDILNPNINIIQSGFIKHASIIKQRNELNALYDEHKLEQYCLNKIEYMETKDNDNNSDNNANIKLNKNIGISIYKSLKHSLRKKTNHLYRNAVNDKDSRESPQLLLTYVYFVFGSEKFYDIMPLYSDENNITRVLTKDKRIINAIKNQNIYINGPFSLQSRNFLFAKYLRTQLNCNVLFLVKRESSQTMWWNDLIAWNDKIYSLKSDFVGFNKKFHVELNLVLLRKQKKIMNNGETNMDTIKVDLNIWKNEINNYDELRSNMIQNNYQMYKEIIKYKDKPSRKDLLERFRKLNNSPYFKDSAPQYHDL